jgi:hypothetical protein
MAATSSNINSKINMWEFLLDEFALDNGGDQQQHQQQDKYQDESSEGLCSDLDR